MSLLIKSWLIKALLVLFALNGQFTIPTRGGIASGSSTPGTYSFTQYTYVAETSSTPVSSITTASGITITSGDTVFVSCRGPYTTGYTITSSPANTFTNYPIQAISSNASQQTGRVFSAASGSTTFTCAPASSLGYMSMVVLDYARSGGAASTDTNTGNSEASTLQSSFTSPSFSTSANALVVVCAAIQGLGQMTAGNIGGVAATLRGVSAPTLTSTGADQGCEDEQFSTAQSGITASMNASINQYWYMTVASVK